MLKAKTGKTWYYNFAHRTLFDTRNSSGVMPSDHRPVMATFEVK
jgi:hypothetical protein